MYLPLLDCKPFEGRGCVFLYALRSSRRLIPACSEQGRDGGPSREEGLGSAPPARPASFLPPDPSSRRRFPPGGRRKSPAALPCPRGAFSGAPAPSASPIRTWPSPQDSQCASGQTYLRQPTTFRVLASPVASNPNFLPLQSPLSRLPINSPPIGWPFPASQWRPRLLPLCRVQVEGDATPMVAKGNAGRRLPRPFVLSAGPHGLER